MKRVLLALALFASPAAIAATSAGATRSPFNGNGHTVTFDGRVFVVAHGDGWRATVLRPGRIGRDAAGFPDVSGAFSPHRLIQPVESCENAIALCEESAESTPYLCDAAGAPNPGGPFACYDLVAIDSNACVPENQLRQRRLKLWVEHPFTDDAVVVREQWSGARAIMHNRDGDELRGIEPTVTRDGRLLVYQGHPDNDGKIDILMYMTTPNPCSVDGWDGPHDLAHMVNDPNVSGRYRLGERVLRTTDGVTFEDERRLAGFVVRDADRFRGAYPWLFPDGDAISFTAVNVPCRAENDPAGCGPRRGGFSVIGYPTNWGIAHVDGPVNPDTDNTVRLFFSSPGPLTFDTIPATPGRDVWPFFGSNTSNYTEIVFDDGIDGQYAGVWLMNESVNKDGNLDRGRSPDTSGYFNTGIVQNASFPLRNEAPHGKSLAFNGSSSRVRVVDDVSLEPVNGLTVEMVVRPDAPVSCDDRNNWRVLLQKGAVGQGAYSLVFEEGEGLQARVRVGGVQRSLVANASLPVGQWSTVAFSYQAATGLMTFRINGVETASATFPPGTLDGGGGDLFIGGPGVDRPACPDENGAFFGQIDEVRLSRIDRFHAAPGEGEGEGEPGEGEGEPGEGEGEPGEGEGEPAEGEGEPAEGEGEPGEGEGEPGVDDDDDDDTAPAGSCRQVGAEVGVGATLALLCGRRRRRGARA